jgi:putative endonuclease
MSKNHALGQKGEQLAADFLEKNGYALLARNWRWGKAEVDLIAQTGQTLVFVEVKTRTHTRFGFPDEAVGAKKERLMVEAAGQFMYLREWENEFRFDVIGIVLGAEAEIRHYPDAFFPFYCETAPDPEDGD